MDNQKDISKQICQSLIRGGQRCLGVKEYSPFAFSSTCLTSCRTCIMQEGEENQPWKRSNVFSHILATCVHQIWIFTDLVFFRWVGRTYKILLSWCLLSMIFLTLLRISPLLMKGKNYFECKWVSLNFCLVAGKINPCFSSCQKASRLTLSRLETKEKRLGTCTAQGQQRAHPTISLAKIHSITKRIISSR